MSGDKPPSQQNLPSDDGIYTMQAEQAYNGQPVIVAIIGPPAIMPHVPDMVRVIRNVLAIPSLQLTSRTSTVDRSTRQVSEPNQPSTSSGRSTNSQAVVNPTAATATSVPQPKSQVPMSPVVPKTVSKAKTRRDHS